MKTASEMTYTVSGGALNSTQTKNRVNAVYFARIASPSRAIVPVSDDKAGDGWTEIEGVDNDGYDFTWIILDSRNVLIVTVLWCNSNLPVKPTQVKKYKRQFEMYVNKPTLHELQKNRSKRA